MTKSLVKRFFEKVEKTSGCWHWKASKDRDGYGKFGVTRRVWRRAHRVMWHMHHGPIPYNMEVLHKCDNPGCVRLDHLYLGTQKDNVHDAIQRGRFVGLTDSNRSKRRGNEVNTAKLTEEQVLLMRKLHNTSAVPYRELSSMFNTSYQNAWAVINRVTWRHV